MSYSTALRDTRAIAFRYGKIDSCCPASTAGYDANGIPLTIRAQWLHGMFASGAMKPNSDYLYRWAQDPNTGKWIRPSVPVGHRPTGRKSRR